MRLSVMAVVLCAGIVAGCSTSDDSYIKNLYSDNGRSRLMAMRALSKRQGDAQTVQKLITEMGKADDRTTYIIAQLLGAMSDTTAVEPLGRLLDSEVVVIRSAACWSIGSIGHASGIPYLLKGVQDPDSNVRYAAAVALGHMYDARAIAPLYGLFRDTEDSVRVAAIQGLYYHRGEKNAQILASDFAFVARDPNNTVRYVAVQALGGGFPDTTAAGELLIEALDDDNKHVRYEAIHSLGLIKYTPAVQVLKKMYDVVSVDEEYAITQAILDISGEEFPPPGWRPTPAETEPDSE